ncbi:hypothetical protein AMTRI_Chr03g53370 [Amborella trichopoda]
MEQPIELEATPESEKMLEEQLSYAMRIDPTRERFPCCIVWTPLPIISWFVPFIGHIGICREDGVILDFAGPNLVSVDNFAFGAVAKYIQLNRSQCRFPPNLAGNKCEPGEKHMDSGTVTTWNEGLRMAICQFQHRSYNIFTCNCHSFVANCLNKLCYGGHNGWNVVNLAVFIFCKGRWVNKLAIARSFLPFVLVLCVGLVLAGWSFLLGLALFSFAIVGWFLFGTCCFKKLIQL